MQRCAQNLVAGARQVVTKAEPDQIMAPGVTKPPKIRAVISAVSEKPLR
jgi:hypothetical protein